MIPTIAPFRLPLRAIPGDFGEDDPHGLTGQDKPDRRALRGKRILLVEDEAILAFELQWALEDAGAKVIGPALTLAEAMTMYAGEEALDGAVLDVNLCGQSVIPLAGKLARAGVPILFNTGHADRADLQARFPGAEVLTKPTRQEVLTARLAELIGRPKPN